MSDNNRMIWFAHCILLGVVLYVYVPLTNCDECWQLYSVGHAEDCSRYRRLEDKR